MNKFAEDVAKRVTQKLLKLAVEGKQMMPGLDATMPTRDDDVEGSAAAAFANKAWEPGNNAPAAGMRALFTAGGGFLPGESFLGQGAGSLFDPDFAGILEHDSDASALMKSPLTAPIKAYQKQVTEGGFTPKDMDTFNSVRDTPLRHMAAKPAALNEDAEMASAK